MSGGPARAAAELAARASYGRLVAILARRTRDLAAAEDALAEAFRAALETWPERGVPDRPEAWLITAARRAHGGQARRARVRADAAAAVARLYEEAAERPEAPLMDERLKLMLVCAHPAIEPAARAPLMLQTVLGLTAERIAAAFLVAPAAMGQRLSRAKTRIRDAGIPFETPALSDLAPRLDAVLAAVYAAFGAGWDDVTAPEGQGGLAAEALFLARLVAALAPDSAEARGLLALICYCEARRPARRASGGAFVPLAEQDPRLWSAGLLREAEAALRAAAALRAPGRCQTEAAIQSLHVERLLTGARHDRALAALYDALCAAEPSVGALVARAAAHGEAFGAEAGLAALEAVPDEARARYQPWHAARAHLLAAAGRAPEAAEAYARAEAMSPDPGVRAFLAARRAALR